MFPSSSRVGFKHCLHFFRKSQKGKNIFEIELGFAHHMVSHTEVTNYSSLSCFSVNEVIGRDMSQISVSQGTGVSRQAPLPGPSSLDLGRSDGLWNSAHCSLVSTIMYFSACFSPWTLGFQLCDLQDGARSWDRRMWGKQHSSSSGLGKIL